MNTISLSFQGPKGSVSHTGIVVMSSTVWEWLFHPTQRRKSDGKTVEVVRPSIASIADIG